MCGTRTIFFRKHLPLASSSQHIQYTVKYFSKWYNWTSYCFNRLFSREYMFFTSFHRSPGSVLSLEGVSSFCKHQSLIKYKNIRAISLSVKQKHQVCIFGIGSKSITTRHRDKFAHYKTQIQKILTLGGLDYTTLYF
jgi:hypothetical protein